jgi:hypothetical protein
LTIFSHRRTLQISITFLSFACFVESFILKCNFKQRERHDVFVPKVTFVEGLACIASDDYFCAIRAYKVEGIATGIKDKRNDVKILEFQKKNFVYILTHVGHVFEELLVFTCNICGISTIEREDLRQFPKLKVLELHGNLLKNLPADMFHSVPMIRYFDLSLNKIENIEDGFFQELKKLESFHIGNNVCIPESDHASELEFKKRRVTHLCIDKKKQRHSEKIILEREIMFPFDPETQAVCNASVAWINEFIVTPE